MNQFELYLTTGIHHITNIQSFDHILFITCLCAVYSLKQWRQILILITAFTLGHTTSLALATFKLVHFNSGLIELLIPVTILITAFWNFFIRAEIVNKKTHWFKYLTALFFGLIHGLGFSNYLQELLGSEKSIALPLFSFNLGIETGQLIIVSIILMFSYILINWFKVPRRDWIFIFSGAGLGISVKLIIDNAIRYNFW